MKEILDDWPGQTPERTRRRDLEAFRAGRFVVHGLPFSTHTELLEPEDLVRGLGYAAGVCAGPACRCPATPKMTDVPCHSWILPTLLKHAGVNFLTSAATRQPVRPGPGAVLVGRARRLAAADLIEPRYGTGLVLRGLALPHLAGTDSYRRQPGPARTRRRGPGCLPRPARKPQGGSRPDRPALRLRRRDPPRACRDSGRARRHAGHLDSRAALRSPPRELARSVRPACGTAELLATHLRLWGLSLPDSRDKLAAAREQGLLYGEHTWGGSLSWVTPYGHDINWLWDAWQSERKLAGRFTRLEESWAEPPPGTSNRTGEIIGTPCSMR